MVLLLLVLHASGKQGRTSQQISSVVFVYWRRRAIFGVVVLLDWIGAGCSSISDDLNP
jgi:hypothetical protein